GSKAERSAMCLELSSEMATEIHVENHVDRRRQWRTFQVERDERRQSLAANCEIGIDRDEAGVLLRQNAIENESAIDRPRPIGSRRRVIDQWRKIDGDELDPFAQ